MTAPAIGPLLGAGKVAEIFAYGEGALKLYRAADARAEAFREAAILAIVATHGLPVPGVQAAGQYGGRWGVVMTRAEGVPLAALAEAEPAQVPAVLDEMVRLHRAMHQRADTRLRPLKARLAANIANAPQLDAGLVARLCAALAARPDGDRLCHGDFHPYNIIGTPGATLIVDWPDATCGPPAADVCRSYLLLAHGAPELAEPYLERYLAAGGIARTEVMAWLPVVAAARLAEGVPAEDERLLRLARTLD